jgi:nucleoid DNA-binding protein
MTKILGKTDLVNEVAKTAKIEKTKAKAAVDATIDVITSALKKGGKVQLTGFGTFSVASRKKRTGVNPQTGAKITIPQRRVPKFVAGKSLKDVVGKK